MDPEAKEWTIGISANGHRFHLCFYGNKEERFVPRCNMITENLRPISDSEIDEAVGFCGKCNQFEDAEELLTGITVKEFIKGDGSNPIVFDDRSAFRRNHITK